MKKVFLVTCLFVFMNACPSFSSEKIEVKKWKNLNDCVEKHILTVSIQVNSLEEGANLIYESLCSDESTDLTNTMVKERKETVSQYDNISDTFVSFRHVILRELRYKIYRKKIDEDPLDLFSK